jgi:hypothetical protein
VFVQRNGRRNEVKRYYKLALWSLIPLLFVGICGMRRWRAPAAHAAVVKEDCEQIPDNFLSQNTYFHLFSAWKCPPVTINSGCLRARKLPQWSAEIIRCFPFSAPDSLEIVCQTSHGQNIHGSDIWDEISTVKLDANQTPVLLFVSDYYMDTTNYAKPSPPIPDCALLHPPAQYPQGSGN